MSLPRQIIPGSTYLVTRRCSQRQFLLAPTPYVAQVFLYCLAVAAQRTGVLVHALTLMSNHYHLVVTDPYGRLPEFCAWLNEFVAKALNVHYGRWENFWANEAASCVRLVGDADVLAKMVYTVANPVAAGLVSHGDQWPGVRLFMPGVHRIERPAGFFRRTGPTPEVATLNIVQPPLVAPATQSVTARVVEAVQACEAWLRIGFLVAGRRFLGRQRVLAQRFTDKPRSPEPRRRLSPRIACGNRWRRIETLQRCKQFIADYRNALRRWCGAARDIVFPVGTYQMVRRYGVAVAPS